MVNVLPAVVLVIITLVTPNTSGRAVSEHQLRQERAVHHTAENGYLKFPRATDLILESFRVEHWDESLFAKLDKTKYLSLLYGNVPQITFESNILETFSVVQTNLSSFLVKPGRNSVLKVLQISRNGLPTVPDSLRYLVGLVTLDLSQNQLTYVDLDLFSDMSTLKNLDLSVNQISTIDASVDLKLNRVRNLWISFNLLQRFDAFPSAFPVLDTVRLIGNMWSCAWVDQARKDIMERRIVAFGVDYNCAESRQGGLCCYGELVSSTTTQDSSVLQEGPLLEEIQKLTSELAMKPLDGNTGDQTLELLTKASASGQEKILVGVKHDNVTVFF